MISPTFSPNKLFYHQERGGLTGTGGGLPRGKIARNNANQNGGTLLGFGRDTGHRRPSDGGGIVAINEPQGRRWGAFDPHSYSISFLSSMHISQLRTNNITGPAQASPQNDLNSFALLNMSLSGLGPRLDVTEVEVLEDQYVLAQEKYQPDSSFSQLAAHNCVSYVDNGLHPTVVESHDSPLDPETRINSRTVSPRREAPHSPTERRSTAFAATSSTTRIRSFRGRHFQSTATVNQTGTATTSASNNNNTTPVQITSPNTSILSSGFIRRAGESNGNPTRGALASYHQLLTRPSVVETQRRSQLNYEEPLQSASPNTASDMFASAQELPLLVHPSIIETGNAQLMAGQSASSPSVIAIQPSSEASWEMDLTVDDAGHVILGDDDPSDIDIQMRDESTNASVNISN